MDATEKRGIPISYVEREFEKQLYSAIASIKKTAVIARYQENK